MLKKSLLNILKIGIPLAFGIFLIWFVFSDLTEIEKKELYASFKSANYFWVLLSLSLGLLSHVSRAVRWKYTIEPLGKVPGFWNSFFTVMIGYLANFALPRLGEVTRPGLLAKYEGIPFNKLFGTIVAERVADMLILILIIIAVVFSQLDLLQDKLYELYNSNEHGFSLQNLLIIMFVAMIGAGIFFFFMLSKSQNTFFVKIRNLFFGVFEGVKSIWTMKNKWKFFLHTILIWVLYIGMFYICCFSIEETKDISLGAILAAFVMGSIAIVLVQGGIGVFPLAIMETLILYGVSKTSALALGWILWSSQTIMLIVVGAISIPLLRWINKKKKIEVAT